MKWKPFVSGKPYTCQDCPAYVDVVADRDKWQELAENIMKWTDPPKQDWARDEYRAALLEYWELMRGE